VEPIASTPPQSGLGFDVAALAHVLTLGGPVVMILAALSVTGLAIALLKILSFRRPERR
jgi:hypothetical protein